MKVIISVFVCLLLSACATYVPVDLAPSGISRAANPHKQELKNITVNLADTSARTGEVRVAPGFLTVWKEALQVSVDKAGVFTDEANEKVNITAEVNKFDFDPVGFSNQVDVEVTYKVVARATGKILFETTIFTTASGSASDTWEARVRLRKLWNTTTQESISKFITALKENNF